jgi:predicted neutral ceramidase superfamily lipid hydrolase
MNNPIPRSKAGVVAAWAEQHLSRYRDAFIYLLYSAMFSILPTISGYLMLKAFGKWNGDWAGLLEKGNLLVASASLMATALYVFRKPANRTGFLKSVSYLMAVLVIVFSTLFYGALALSAHGIVPPQIKMLPPAIITASLVLYGISLLIGFHALYSEQTTPPSNLEVRNAQVSELEAEMDQLGGGQ